MGVSRTFKDVITDNKYEGNGTLEIIMEVG